MEVSQSQAFTAKSVNDDIENDVEFLVEVRVPCLVCGVDIEFDTSCVKQEVDQFEESVEECQPGWSTRGAVDHDLFHWFLNRFGAQLVKKRKQVNKGWDGDGGDILRFCGNCKKELMRILDFQKQKDELEKKVKNGLVELKKKMERFEETFQSNGIYERDHRYKLVRKKIVNCGRDSSGHIPQSKQQSSLGQVGDHNRKRISSRLKVKANLVPSPRVKSEPIENTNASKVNNAFVMISSLDKDMADRYLISKYPNVSPDTTFNITSNGKKLRATTGNKIVQKPARIIETIAQRKPTNSQKLVQKQKQSVQKEVTSRKFIKLNNKLTRTPIPVQSKNASNTSDKSVLKDYHNGNDNQPHIEYDKFICRPQRNRRNINYATGALIDDKHNNSEGLSVGDNNKDLRFKRRLK